MKKINYKSINETLYHHQLTNGLNIFILPKQGFSKTFVTFSSQLGGMNRLICNDKEKVQLPQGIAHFLEHKLFEQNGDDISSKFALNQANVNAYTSANRTTFLFSTTDKVLDNIALLLDFVLFPNFTNEGIEKEKSIIAQEINMYKDDPNSMIYYGTLENMYQDHPVKNEILGSIDSINTINKEMLELAHSTFYDPAKMVLFIAGNVEPADTIKFIENNIKETKKSEYRIENLQPASDVLTHKERSGNHEIMVPNYVLGVKLKPHEDKATIIKKELTISVLFDLLIGKSTDNYKSLLEKNLINDTFGLDITIGDTYSYLMLGSDTYNPDLLDKELRKILLNVKNMEITPDKFLKTKKQLK